MTGHLSPLFKQTKINSIVKPYKPADKAESYRPIALLSLCYKLLERLVCNRILPVIDTNILPEQAGIRPGRSCCHQVLALTTHIERGYENNKNSSDNH